MKKNAIWTSLSILLVCCAFVLGNTLAAFASSDSMIDALSEKEKALFDALIEIATEEFSDPSGVRILEVGDYNDRASYQETNDSLAEPDLVIVRLQGENKTPAINNNYYKVCIKGYEKTGDLDKKIIENDEELIKIKEQLVAVDGALGNSSSKDYKDLIKLKSELMEYKAETGDYMALADDYEFEVDASDTFDIGKINKAIKEYWENLGF